MLATKIPKMKNYGRPGVAESGIVVIIATLLPAAKMIDSAEAEAAPV